MLIKVNGVEKEVTVLVNESKTAVMGSVGNIAFKWEPSNFTYPAPYRNGQYAPYAKKTVYQYLMAYKEALALKRKSPLHFNESNDLRVYESDSNYDIKISGVPMWMRENHKSWTPCYSRTTGELLYYRRTRFKESSKDIVKEYLHACCECQMRENCYAPCVTKQPITIL